MLMRKMKSRGFIGPIGDDLPSLIPLLFGLMIFFSMFTFTFKTFDDKTAAFQDDLDALKIASSLRGNNFIFNYAQFKSLCGRIHTQRLNFIAGIAELRPAPNETVFNVEFLRDGTGIGANTYVCPFPKPEFDEKASTGNKIVAKVFPIALQTTNSAGTGIVLPERLVVIVWK